MTDGCLPLVVAAVVVAAAAAAAGVAASQVLGCAFGMWPVVA